jgi:hypothetical protein
VATAITASLLGVSLAARLGTKTVYIAGLACGLTSMVLLIVSQFFESQTSVAYTCCSLRRRFSAPGSG